MAIKLRDYQQDSIQAFKDARNEEKENRFLLTAAVGAGKTVISSTIISEEVRHQGGRCLFLCHRQELIDQTVGKLAMVDDSLNVGVIQGSRDEWQGRDVVIASIQTLSSKKRLTRIPSDYFSLVVVDETHRVSAPSYLRTLEYFRCTGDNPTTTLLGITATAKRTDGVSLGEVYQRHVYDIGLLELIERGALVPIKALSVETGVDLDGIKKRLGDFADNELAAVLNTANRNDLIAKAMLQHAPDRKSLVFCVNIKHAIDLAATLNRHGIRTEAVHGGLLPEKRRAILDAFHKGDLQALTSVMVLIEGFDCPPVNCVVWATKTMSHIKYIQGIGRGTRLSPETGKTDLLVLDMADTCSRHSLMSVDRLFDLGDAGKRALKAGRSVVEAKEADALAAEKEAVRRRLEAEERAQGVGLVARSIDLFEKPLDIPDKLKRSKFEWLVIDNSRLMAVLPTQAHIYIWRSHTIPGLWSCDILVGKDFELKKHIGKGSLDDVTRFALAYLEANKWMIKTIDTMRKQPPTPGQKAAIRRFGDEIPPNKYAATQVIALGVAKSHFRKLRKVS